MNNVTVSPINIDALLTSGMPNLSEAISRLNKLVTGVADQMGPYELARQGNIRVPVSDVRGAIPNAPTHANDSGGPLWQSVVDAFRDAGCFIRFQADESQQTPDYFVFERLA